MNTRSSSPAARRQIGSAAGDVLNGSDGPDGLFGGPGADTLSGGQDGDLIDGGAGTDVLSGGGGADHFLVEAGQSAPGAMDRITDWEAGDALSFGQQAANSGNYVESTAASAVEALVFANAQIAGGSDGICRRGGGIGCDRLRRQPWRPRRG